MASLLAERKNQAIWDAIDSGSPKSALALCNRRLKKGEKGDTLLLLKAHSLSLIQPATQANLQEALGICRSIVGNIASVCAGGKMPEDLADVLGFLGRVWRGLVDLGVGGKEGGKTEKGGRTESGREEVRRELGKLWEAAVRARPGDERLAKEWFLSGVRGVDWRDAQKAAMHLQKAFPKRREYFFWAITSCLLLHGSLPETVAGRKLFGTLAYRMIIKAKGEVPLDNLVIPPRAIHTAQEIHLLLTIIQHTSPATTPIARSIEALAVLDSKNLGLESKIGKGDYLGLLRRKLALLKEVSKWSTLWEMCGALLRNARVPNKEVEEQSGDLPDLGDDWALWDSYLTAAQELMKEEQEFPEEFNVESIKSETLKMITDYLSSGVPGTRNSELAMVKFASIFHGRDGHALHPAPEGTPSLVDACKRYFRHVGNKNCCFEDLGRYVEMFDDTEQDEWLCSLKASLDEDNGPLTPAKIARQINTQKFIYFLKISPLPFTLPSAASSGENNGISSDLETALKRLDISDSTKPTALKESLTSTLSAFASSSLKIYISSLTPALSQNLIVTDNQHGDEAALLCVTALLRLWKLHGQQTQTHVLRAIIILETVLKKSRHNYQALLLLTRLYILVGAPYLAASGDCWTRLAVKQIQTDTLGHWLFTRGSSIFPLSPEGTGTSSGPGDADLCASLSRSLQIYQSNRKQTPDMMVLALDRGSYGQVTEFVEFGTRVEGSVCRGLYEVERRRAARLRSTISDSGSTANNTSNADNGDDLTSLMPWTADMIGDPDTGRVVDNRDFGVSVNFERSGRKFEECALRVGEQLPRERWTIGFSLAEEAVALLKSGNNAPAQKRVNEVLAVMEEVLERDVTTPPAEFTEQEKRYLGLVILLCKLFLAASPGSGNPTTVGEILSQLKTAFTTPPSSAPPDQPYSHHTLHTSWLAFESSLITHALLRALKPSQLKPSSVKQAVQELLSKLLPEYVEDVKKSAMEAVERCGDAEKEVAEALGDGGVKGDEGFVLEKELREAGGVGDVDVLAGLVERVRKGREAAVEGVRKWKLGGK